MRNAIDAIEAALPWLVLAAFVGFFVWLVIDSHDENVKMWTAPQRVKVIEDDLQRRLRDRIAFLERRLANQEIRYITREVPVYVEVPVEKAPESPPGSLEPRSAARIASLMQNIQDRRKALVASGASLDEIARSDLSRSYRADILRSALLVETGSEANLAEYLWNVKQRFQERIDKWHRGVPPAPGACGDDLDAQVYDLLLREL